MKFSPKCNTKSDIGKFVIKFGNFCFYLRKKQGLITGPKSALGKSLHNIFYLSGTELLLQNTKISQFSIYSQTSVVRTSVFRMHRKVRRRPSVPNFLLYILCIFNSESSNVGSSKNRIFRTKIRPRIEIFI